MTCNASNQRELHSVALTSKDGVYRAVVELAREAYPEVDYESILSAVS